MLEYVFFNPEPCARFRGFVEEKGVPSSLARGELELIVQLDEGDVDDALADIIDAHYDEMFALDQRLYEADLGSSAGCHTSGVVVNLADGRSVYAGVRPDLLAKVMQALSARELGELVEAIVDAVEVPDERGLCRRSPDDR
jgi:hypothetical protein